MSGSDTCRVKVVCRVRPLNAKEQANGNSFVITFPSETTVSLGTRVFQYDHVLQPVCTQQDVYALAARPLVKDVLSGYNATIFAYGQTASGKTHTMEGVMNDVDMQGVIPRIVQDIFEHIYIMDANLEIHVKVSYFEIYMERIRDLLDVTNYNLPIGETKNRVPYVKGITERFVTSSEEVLAVLEDGKASRHVSVTNMNAHSSRSHAVFSISIKQESKENRKTLTGKLYLVDLAGSEKVGKTNAEGLTLDEAKNINKSLLSLSNVISALADGSKPFIPYRDSKLTRVLQESLGGNARTTLIICCSPSSFNESESKSTLMFGDRAKTIKNTVAVNMELTAEEWKRRFEKERESNQKLRAVIEKYEAELARWRIGESVPEMERASLKLKEISLLPIASDDSLSSLSPSPSPVPTPIPRGHAPLTTSSPAAFQAFEEDRAKLYQQLDEKEDELQSQTELVEKLSLQLQETEENLEGTQQECSMLKKQIAVIEQELVNSQDEVHEVMQALEELAISYDTKDREIEANSTDKQVLASELEKLQQQVDKKTQALMELEEATQTERRKKHEMISTLFRDLNEVGVVVGTKSEERLKTIDSSTDITDEDFTRARIHLSNLRCEVRTLTEQRDILEKAEREAKDRAQTIMKQLSNCRLKISQFETQNEALQANLRESELKKQELEQSLSLLNSQLITLKTQEQMLLSSEVDREQEQSGLRHSANEVKRALEDQLEYHRGTYQHQVDNLRAEIAAKEAQISQLTEQYQMQEITMDTLRNELQQVQEQYSQEKDNYTRIETRMWIKERTKQDLGGLTDTVSCELDRLNQLRQAYLQKITRKLKSKSVDEDHITMSPNRREIRFLERNLEDLSRAQKKITSENVEMHRDIPRLHAILVTKSKHIGELEHMLRETRETASREFERLRAENEKLKQSFQAKLKEKEREYHYGKVVKRPSGPQIARPVPRKESGTSREALLNWSGVSVLGQRNKPSLLNPELDSMGRGGGNGGTSKYGFLILALMAVVCAFLWHCVAT